MNPELSRLFEELEAQRKSVLDSVAALKPENFNFCPTPDKWSVAQILSHIISAERMSVRYIQKKIQGVDSLGDSGLLEEMKMVGLIVSQRIPALKFKAPRVVVEHTVQYSDFHQLSHEWASVRSQLKNLLENIPEKYVNRKIYRHARAGYLNGKHALIFFREHIVHHMPQIKRLVNPK